ncbi:hypothetical protein D3H35_18795 [Cohnella faecalis]|uniref:Uncharacterized protein n=1 Tax=Cohnella faecalis TaxID=2315694 RepID=A0A398CK34_9BACL|nr:hypothetical protein D3H35_18795 [Cohnella faecalis]
MSSTLKELPIRHWRAKSRGGSRECESRGCWKANRSRNGFRIIRSLPFLNCCRRSAGCRLRQSSGGPHRHPDRRNAVCPRSSGQLILDAPVSGGLLSEHTLQLVHSLASLCFFRHVAAASVAYVAITTYHQEMIPTVLLLNIANRARRSLFPLG